jgi:hypothetical protein
VVGTTYQELHVVVDNIVRAGFFDVSGAGSAGVAVGSSDIQARVEPTSDLLGTKTGQLTECETPHDGSC